MHIDLPHMSDDKIERMSNFQVGQAAALRFDNDMDRSDRQILNKMIHSADETTQNERSNPYYDTSRSYNAEAQVELDRIAASTQPKPKH